MTEIKAENFYKELRELLNDYVHDVEEIVKRNVDIIAEEAKIEVESNSPMRRGLKKTKGISYSKGWTANKSDRSGEYNIVIKQRKPKYRLTHLLEFGHATRNGGRTKAFPHIRNVELSKKEKLLNNIKKDIERLN